MITRPYLTSLPAVVLALLCLPVLDGLGIDNSLEVWLDESGHAYREYEEFRGAFGSEEFILLVYPCPDPIDLEFLEDLTDLRFELEELAGVGRVDDLARVYSRLYSMPGDSVRGLESFRRAMSDSPLLSGFLISPDGRLAATWVHLDLEGTGDRGAVVAAVEEVAGALAHDSRIDDGALRLAGSPYLNAALDRSSQSAARTFFPLVFLLCAVVLLALFRHPAGVVVPFVSVGTGILWTLALLALSGSSLNMVTVALPPLVWVLGLSTSIHLLSRWSRAVAEGADFEEATRLTLSALWRPCLYSSVTTAIGFASLSVSSMRPVREMGVFAAMGVLLCLAANFLLFPALIGLAMKVSRRPLRHREDHPVFATLAWAIGRPRPLLALAAALVLALAVAIPSLEAESNPIEFFHDASAVAVTYEQVLPGFTGPYSLEVVLEPPRLDVEALMRLDEIRAHLESQEGVARALSILDFFKAQGGALPETARDLEDAWRRIERHPEELEAFFVNGSMRFAVLAQPMDSSAHRRLVAHVESYLEREVDSTWRPRVTGIVPLLVDMQDRLVESQVRTFALAFLTIMVVLGFLMKRLSYALVSLGPNLVPIVFALGTMGWLGIRLDPATTMIAGIALGIAVDDTIHFLDHYRRRREAGRGTRAAVAETLDAVGRPMVITSLVAAMGFLALCFSDFVPLFHFGLLTAVTMGAALLGDLVILPSLLMVTSPPDRRPPDRRPTDRRPAD